MTDDDGAFVRRLVTVFADLEDLEDDEGLAGAELWVARTRDHAAHAASYAASGLLGLLSLKLR